MDSRLPQFLFYPIQGIWSYIEATDLSGAEIHVEWYEPLSILLQMARQTVWPASPVEDAVFSPVHSSCQNSGVHGCVELVYVSDRHVCFHTNTILLFIAIAL